MGRSSGVSLPCRVLLLQILLGSLLFLLSCQELRASSLPDRRIRRDSDTNLPISDLAKMTQEDRNSKLLFYSRTGNVEMVRLLLLAGANPSADDGWRKNTPLCVAARAGHVEVVKELLRAGTDHTLLDYYGYSSLELAALYGHIDVVRVLLQHSADPTQPGLVDNTAAYQATTRDDNAMLELLLKHATNCIIKSYIHNVYNFTLLHYAASKGQTSIVRTMAANGCHVNSTDEYGMIPLHDAARMGHEETVRALVELGADINKQNIHGKTPLHFVVRDSGLGAVRALMMFDAGIIIQDTPLHFATSILGTVRALVELGAEVNIQDIDGNTPLHLAVLQSSKNLEVVRGLVELGAGINIQNIYGKTPLHLAIWWCESRSESLRARLVELGAGAQDNHDNTPLTLAVQDCTLGTVRGLLELGAGINIQDNHGKTPLNLAVQYCTLGTVRGLLELGAGINIQDNHGDTPLHLAVAQADTDKIRAIIELGAQLNVKNKASKTPLAIAYNYKYETIANILESHGATV